MYIYKYIYLFMYKGSELPKGTRSQLGGLDTEKQQMGSIQADK